MQSILLKNAYNIHPYIIGPGAKFGSLIDYNTHTFFYIIIGNEHIHMYMYKTHNNRVVQDIQDCPVLQWCYLHGCLTDLWDLHVADLPAEIVSTAFAV